MSKRIMIVVFILLNSTLLSQWVKQFSASGEKWIVENDSTFMLYGNILANASLYVTNDKGKHWIQKPRTVFTSSKMMTYYSMGCGYAISSQKEFYKTVDTGKTWTLTGTNQPNIGTNSIVSLYVADSLRIFILMNASSGAQLITLTTDGGVTWKQIPIPVKDVWRNIQFLDKNYGILAGTVSLLRTFNGGLNWEQVPMSGYSGGQSLMVFKNYAVGWLTSNGSTMRTLDSGKTWTVVSDLPAKFLEMKFVNNQIGYARFSDEIYRTTNGGETWTALPKITGFTSQVMQSLLVTPSGSVFTTISATDGGIFSFCEDSKALYLIYPNNPSINTADSIQTVKWSSWGMSGTTVSILISFANGSPWQVLKSNVPIDSNHIDILIPFSLNPHVRIKIASDQFPAISVIGSHFTYYNNKERILFSPNEFAIYLYSNGTSAYNNAGTGSSGLYWPHGIDNYQTAIFEDGLVWAGKENGTIKCGGSTYRSGLQGGRILPNGMADNPDDNINALIFQLKKEWENLPEGGERDFYRYNYEMWPAHCGAPYVDIDGDNRYLKGFDKPQQWGDKMAWFVANDLDSNKTKYLYGTLPISVEMQCLTFGFNTPLMKDVLFKKYKLVNKSKNTIRDMYFGYWSDPDLGNANDDVVGCDTVRNIGYCYNGDNNDEGSNGYGAAPPAIGYVIVQGPAVQTNSSDSAYYDNRWIHGKKNLPLTAFSFYVGGSAVYADADLGVSSGAEQMYNNMRGLLWDGQPCIHPFTNLATTFCFSGDPVTRTGWNDDRNWPFWQAPGDRRILLSSGPFDFAPRETQEFVIAYVIARGTDNINSIKVMRELADSAKAFYYSIVPPKAEDYRVIPTSFSLDQNYPNPFNPTTTIKYALPTDGRIVLKIYNALGELVETLLNEEKLAGTYSAQFNAKHYSSGVYFYQMEYSGMRSVKKMIILR